MTVLTPDVVADLSQENARLQAELRAARDRQTASAEILHTISSVSGDAEQSLHQIAETTKRLFEASSVSIFVAEGDKWSQIIHDGASSQRIGAEIPAAQLQIGGHSLPGATISENRQIHLPDIDHVDPAIADWPGLRPARAAGTRTLSGTPLRHAGHAIGVLIVHRDRLAPFNAEELALLQNFADQAAIAIENARLFNSIREARDGQNASAEILRTIASAPGDAERSLQQIAETTARLFACQSVRIRIAENSEWVRTIAVGASAERVGAAVSVEQARIGERNLPGTVVLENRQVHIPDLDNLDPAMADWPGLPHARAAGTRTMAGTPLRHEGKAIGVLVVYRDRLAPFTAEELALLQSFADQAVIAIENARLFNETKEALERQTATADILKVIASSPADTTPVFEAIAASANRLLGGFSAAVFRFVDGSTHLAAFTPVGPAADAGLKADFPKPVDEFEPFQLARNGSPFLIPDTEETPYLPIKEIARLHGFRSMLFMPLMNGDAPIGIISVTRLQSGTFSPNHIQLLQTFADQAVIAIENTRLFNETREALEQQKASAEILSVISNSVADTQPVFDKILHSIEHLFGGEERFIFLVGEDGLLHIGAGHSPRAEQARALFPAPMEGTVSEVAIRERRLVSSADIFNDPGIPPAARERYRRLGANYSMVVAPMLWEDRAIGSILVARTSMEPFSEKECSLLRTFADQAVIAIQNARLLNETKEALERQTATADILKVIASSPSDVQPVFEAIAASANRLIGGFSSTVFQLVDGIAFLKAFTPTTPAADEVLKATFPRPVADFPPFRMAQAGEVTQIPDTEVLSDDILNISRARGFRSMLFAPLMNDGVSIGFIVVTRGQPGAFAAHHVQLLQTFADQAVIAIENVRLFDEVQARTRELSQSLDELRTAQDRLVQTEKLASLGQLTAGIAHEIKNPLNFVNNFAALSAELTDELNQVLQPAPLASNIRDEVDELTGLLKDNLQKVVQHGKRADSIVKNMLLHSREGSGEHRPADINALLDESLNLAYHGARAEKPQFNVTLRREFDDMAGTVELFPQEITRVLLNLISNGFYAVTKRKSENDSSDFEPQLHAATRNLGDSVEIRIRDNGTGIPAEVKEKMFNPFFTTKPAGEGTGLGLSMSHDIIVKQHGGRIDVETEPGQFTEFRIVLPRKSSSNQDRGQT